MASIANLCVTAHKSWIWTPTLASVRSSMQPHCNRSLFVTDRFHASCLFVLIYFWGATQYLNEFFSLFLCLIFLNLVLHNFNACRLAKVVRRCQACWRGPWRLRARFFSPLRNKGWAWESTRSFTMYLQKQITLLDSLRLNPFCICNHKHSISSISFHSFGVGLGLSVASVCTGKDKHLPVFHKFMAKYLSEDSEGGISMVSNPKAQAQWALP